jgi:ribonuclease PH
VDLQALGERTIYVDCDVVEADGGTRCASISGAYLALHLALKKAVDGRNIKSLPLNDSVAAVSVGLVKGVPVVDLEYSEDCTADIDMNVVMTGSGRIIDLLDLAAGGIGEIIEAQGAVIAATYALDPPRTK